MTKRLTTVQKLVNAQHRATARRQAAETTLKAADKTLATHYDSAEGKAVRKASSDEMDAYLAAFDARHAG